MASKAIDFFMFLLLFSLKQYIHLRLQFNVISKSMTVIGVPVVGNALLVINLIVENTLKFVGLSIYRLIGG